MIAPQLQPQAQPLQNVLSQRVQGAPMPGQPITGAPGAPAGMPGETFNGTARPTSRHGDASPARLSHGDAGTGNACDAATRNDAPGHGNASAADAASRHAAAAAAERADAESERILVMAVLKAADRNALAERTFGQPGQRSTQCRIAVTPRTRKPAPRRW